ncbi:multimeric flavodoxin WrbA [Curtobacterium luteum]|uniref:Multimeric flavodoxin WrbA n=1 Tax=Curtobacterium luteum TaxID=33881 RepID=A0ABS2RWT3_9MICO|nr:flavodoxin family protein [Curtobacterium luteum]MBM7803485.1 multimeric flavodoxin WrbA [Curtobacterium luteum]NUU50238.1 flavodoxin family protein [Curtobacterium luteum]
MLAVNGSERADGDTAQVLGHCTGRFAANGVALEIVTLAKVSMSPCGPCGPCGDCNTRMERCLVDDDVRSIVDRLERVDGVIYATPVHGFGTASLMQTFLERAGVGHLRFRRPLANKVGGAVVVARRYAHDAVIAQLTQNMLLNRMIVPGSGFPAVLRTENDRSPLADAEGLVALNAMVDRVSNLIHLLRSVDLRQLESGTRNEREALAARQQVSALR